MTCILRLLRDNCREEGLHYQSQSATIPVFVVVCLILRVTCGRRSDGHLSLVSGKAIEHMGIEILDGLGSRPEVTSVIPDSIALRDVRAKEGSWLSV